MQKVIREHSKAWDSREHDRFDDLLEFTRLGLKRFHTYEYFQHTLDHQVVPFYSWIEFYLHQPAIPVSLTQKCIDTLNDFCYTVL